MTVSTAVVIGITGSIAGMDKAWPIIEWVLPAHRAYARDVSMEKFNALHTAQLENKKALDYLILKDERQALQQAKDDLERDPHSGTAKEKIELLESSIAVRQERLRAKPSGG
jgi:hypothetical protein